MREKTRDARTWLPSRERRDEGLPSQHTANRWKEIRHQAILDDEADVTQRHRLVDELSIVKVRDEHDLRRRAAFLEPGGGGNAVQPGHGDIEHKQVRLESTGGLHGR